MASSSTPAARPALFADAPEPKSKLGYYRVLSPSCGLRVSPLCLGAMNFGDAWAQFMGEVEGGKDGVFNILEHYYQQGGNFIDTANGYQNEQSEAWIGEWLEKTGRRDEFVIATKFTSGYKNQTKSDAIRVGFAGNSRKSLHVSVEDSLKKLRTSYIDLLYVHWWDYTVGVDELMQGLNHLVQSGKVLYLGISDTPAWVVAKANQYARDHGLSPFVVYQGKWSLATRDFERDIIPMTKSEGMALAPWGVLGGGAFKTDEEIQKMKEEHDKGRTPFDPKGWENTRRVVHVLEKLAKQKNTNVAGIALAYVLAKTPYVFPILGCRKISQLQGSIDALTNVSLTPEELKELEDASPIDLGFPHDFIGTSAATCKMSLRAGKFDFVEEPRAIQYHHIQKK